MPTRNRLQPLHLNGRGLSVAVKADQHARPAAARAGRTSTRPCVIVGTEWTSTSSPPCSVNIL